MIPYSTVIDNLPLFLLADELFADVLEVGKVIQTAHLIPRLGREPTSWVVVGVFQADTTSQQETPLIFIHFRPVLQDVDTQDEREQ